MTATNENDLSVSGHVDPQGETPWAMQLVIHIDKNNPPTRTAVCEAAATAVAQLLADPRATTEWADAITRWTDGRIRKHARRATRPAAWAKVAELPGVTVEHNGARVRAFVPTPVDAIPADIGKLQLTGTELDDPNQVTSIDPAPGGALVVSINPRPNMPTGKAAAAAGHAAQVATYEMDANRLVAWHAAGYPVAVEHPDPNRWDALEADAPVRIVDAGFTVVEPGTTTAIGRWA